MISIAASQPANASAVVLCPAGSPYLTSIATTRKDNTSAAVFLPGGLDGEPESLRFDGTGHRMGIAIGDACEGMGDMVAAIGRGRQATRRAQDRGASVGWP